MNNRVPVSAGGCAGTSLLARDLRPLLLVLCCGLVVRLVLAKLLERAGAIRMSDDFLLFGQQFLDSGMIYDDPVRAPLTTLVSAVMLKAFGTNALVGVVGLQLMLSTVTMLAMAYVADAVWGARAGLVAAGLIAVDPLQVMFSVTVSSEAIFAPTLAMALAFVVRASAGGASVSSSRGGHRHSAGRLPIHQGMGCCSRGRRCIRGIFDTRAFGKAALGSGRDVPVLVRSMGAS